MRVCKEMDEGIFPMKMPTTTPEYPVPGVLSLQTSPPKEKQERKVVVVSTTE